MHGTLVTSEGLKPDPIKIEAVASMPRPDDKRAVQRLLVTEKNVMFTWDSSQEEAFQAIKSMISSVPLLKNYDVASETTIQCAASESVWEQLCSKKESWLHLHHRR